MTTAGPLNDEPEGDTLTHDVACVLLSYTRDRPGGGVIGRRLADAEARALAAELAPALSERIGGRYVPKRDDAQRRKRNAEVVAAFTGRNHAELKRRFKISHRLLNYILEEARKKKVAQRI